MKTLAFKGYNKNSRFMKTYKSLTAVLMDHKLAALGDAYVNFAYSLVLSDRNEQPSGARVKGRVLAEALKKAGLRECLPSRMNRHMLADAAEALIVYGWLNGLVTLEESVTLLGKTEDGVEAFSQLLLTIKSRVRF